MRLIFIVISLLLLVPSAIAWHFQDMPTFISLSLINALVIVSSVFLRDPQWTI